MTGLLAVAFQSGDISIRQSTSPIFSAETNLVTCAHTAEYLAGYKSADDLRPPLLLLLLLAQTARTSSKVHQPTTATTTSEMEGIKQKIKSCKCDKNQTNAAGQRDCASCSTPGNTCTCKVNKCRCAGCPNARSKTKEGKDATSSSSSDDEARRKTTTTTV